MFPFKRFRAVIFDWNGTLLNDFWLIVRTMQEIFYANDMVPPSEDVYRNEMDASSAATIERFYHENGIPPRVTLAEMDAIRICVTRRYWEDAALFPRVPDVLRECCRCGMFCGLVSMEVHDILEKRLYSFGIRHYFHSVQGDAKDKRAALAAMLETAGIAPKDAVYVDDTDAGIRAAKQAGMHTVGVLGGYSPEERIRSTNPSYVVHAVADLLACEFQERT